MDVAEGQALSAGQQRARRAVEATATARGWDVRDLAAAAEVDAGTVGDFLSGVRWPRMSTRGKLEVALGWPPRTIAAIADGEVAGPPDGSAQPRPSKAEVRADIEASDDFTDQEKRALLAMLDAMPPPERPAKAG